MRGKEQTCLLPEPNSVRAVRTQIRSLRISIRAVRTDVRTVCFKFLPEFFYGLRDVLVEEIIRQCLLIFERITLILHAHLKCGTKYKSNK